MADAATQPAGEAHGAQGGEHKSSDRGDRLRNEKWTRGGGRGGRGGRGRGNGRGGRGGPRGGGRGGNRNYQSRDRDEDERARATSDDPDEIRAQVEFYFSDSNLSKDKFLWEKTGGPENRPVDIETIASFSLMRRFKPFAAVVAALKDSEVLTVLEDKQVARITPLQVLATDFDENRRLLAQQALPKTLYVKGFPRDQDIRKTQARVQAFFKPYGIAEVRLRRLGDDAKTFKGSVFVEFPSAEDAERFRAQAPAFQDRPLEVLWKKDYIDREVGRILDHLDAAAFPAETKDAHVAAVRARLEEEYMDPQAPAEKPAKKADAPIAAESKTEEGVDASLVAAAAAKAKAQYVEQQNREREAKKAAAQEARAANKRARSGAEEGEEPAAKRVREEDGKAEERTEEKPAEAAAPAAEEQTKAEEAPAAAET